MVSGPRQPDLDDRLLRAAVASHRRWFRDLREGNRFVEGDLEDVEGLVREARERGGPFGVWTLGRDDALGVRLVARGFGWGWRPHWMGVEIKAPPPAGADFEVVPAAPPFARTLPFGEEGPLPPEAIHLGVRLREKLIGEAVVLPGEDGVAGIFSMGVVPKVQGRGIGLALTRAALGAAWERGCDAAVLNATSEGERLYARAGFRSLGWGQTWWLGRDAPSPTARQVAIAEAAGLGDLEGLEALAPSEGEIAGREPEGASTAPLVLAVLVGQARSVDHLLGRFPALAELRVPPHGGNLLHVAVEHDRPETIEVALRHGVDPKARDDEFGATPAGWAEYLGRDVGEAPV